MLILFRAREFSGPFLAWRRETIDEPTVTELIDAKNSLAFQRAGLV